MTDQPYGPETKNVPMSTLNKALQASLTATHLLVEIIREHQETAAGGTISDWLLHDAYKQKLIQLTEAYRELRNIIEPSFTEQKAGDHD